jgi:predicted lipid-binding transport protein (Tim44 family)
VAGVDDTTVDRESAHEIIGARVAAAARTAPAPVRKEAEPDSSLGGMLGGLFGGSSGRDTAVQAMVKSAARSIGSQAGRALIRGVLGSILKR